MRNDLREEVRRVLPRRMKRRILDAQLVVRRVTADVRRLPDFLVIGAMRCGTSSAFKYLAAHPSIQRPLRKEVEFFSHRFAEGMGWYRAHFPLALPGRHTFEASPYYLYHPHAAERASQVLPDTRIVALLRDPVERALSHHRHMQRLGLETLPFDKAVQREDERLGGEGRRIAEDPGYVSKAHQRFSYRGRGEYAAQLRRWVDRYGLSRVHVIWSDDLYDDPERTLDLLFDFLDLSAHRLAVYENHSYAPGRNPGHTSEMLVPRSTEERLREHYRPHDQALEQLLGREVPWRRR